jgi:hypothetical protein
MTSPAGKLTALACHLTKRVNKAKELSDLSTNIGYHALSSKLELDGATSNDVSLHKEAKLGKKTVLVCWVNG